MVTDQEHRMVRQSNLSWFSLFLDINAVMEAPPSRLYPSQRLPMAPLPQTLTHSVRDWVSAWVWEGDKQPDDHTSWITMSNFAFRHCCFCSCFPLNLGCLESGYETPRSQVSPLSCDFLFFLLTTLTIKTAFQTWKPRPQPRKINWDLKKMKTSSGVPVWKKGHRSRGAGQRDWTEPTPLPTSQHHTSSEGDPGDILGCDTPFPGLWEADSLTWESRKGHRHLEKSAACKSDWQLPYMWNTSTQPDEYDLLSEVWRHGGENPRGWLFA